jgi:hypothetical protein
MKMTTATTMGTSHVARCGRWRLVRLAQRPPRRSGRYRAPECAFRRIDGCELQGALSCERSAYSITCRLPASMRRGWRRCLGPRTRGMAPEGQGSGILCPFSSRRRGSRTTRTRGRRRRAPRVPPPPRPTEAGRVLDQRSIRARILKRSAETRLLGLFSSERREGLPAIAIDARHRRTSSAPLPGTRGNPSP